MGHLKVFGWQHAGFRNATHGEHMATIRFLGKTELLPTKNVKSNKVQNKRKNLYCIFMFIIRTIKTTFNEKNNSVFGDCCNF